MRPEPTPSEPGGVQLRTLGCRLNQAESDEIRAALIGAGWRTDDRTAPDVVLVNTCTVTAEATKASRKLIRRTISDYPDARVLVTGCYAVVDPEEVAGIAGVDGILVAGDPEAVVERITAGLPTSARTADTATRRMHRSGATGCRPRVNLKVQTGCDEACTFCIVPRTRGGLSSRSRNRVFDSARVLVASGARELILTGVHLAKYGWDRNDRNALVRLVEDLCELEGLQRLRLSSIEASHVDEALLRVIADQPKACAHLHLPLQTGDEAVWRAMRRPGTLDHFRRVAARGRELIPGLTLTTDVMVGFPGESERAFSNTLAVVEELAFRKLHVFRFSARPGTPAAALPGQVAPELKRERSERLRVLGDRLRREWHRGRVGETVEVLVEESGGGSPPWLSGVTGDYLRVRTAGPAAWVGAAATVLVTSFGTEFVEGEIVGGMPVLQDRRRIDSVRTGGGNQQRARLS